MVDEYIYGTINRLHYIQLVGLEFEFFCFDSLVVLDVALLHCCFTSTVNI